MEEFQTKSGERNRDSLMRYSYFSNSKFADWVRGVPKPRAETADGWSRWRDSTKKSHPIRYWLAEELLDGIDEVINWPRNTVNSGIWYLKNRYFIKSHCLTANPRDIKPGQWCDLAERLLYCSFNELVDFVEVECASIILSGRSRRLGEKYLTDIINMVYTEEWGIEKDDPLYGQPMPQSDNHQEILDLYHWWLERPNRTNPSCPFPDNGIEMFLTPEKLSPQDREQVDQWIKLSNETDERYRREDDEMLIRLVKVRHSLWT